MILLLPAWIALSLVMAAAWMHQRRAANGGWADVYWSFGLGACGAAVALATGDGFRSWLVAVAIALWSVRLGGYILLRTRRGSEDTRYAQFREDWGAAFQTRMFWFLQIQALAALVLVLPVLLAARSPRAFGWPDAAAIAILLLAVIGEAVADHQMHAFRRDPGNRGKVCDTGLWGWSRHPNYVCEVAHWLAYPLFAIGGDWSWLGWIGPVFMYWLIVHVSGIPPLEAQMLRSRGDAYRAYQRRVPAFLPFPKRTGS